MINRRTFLINSGIVAAGSLLSADTFAGTFNKKRIGLQLYSLRDEVKDGLAPVFKKMASAGYNSVEMYGYNTKDVFFKNSAKEVAAMLKANNIISPSGHYQLDLFDNDGQQTIDAAKELGHKYIVIPWFPEEQRNSLDDYKVIAERINKAALLCKKNNIKMAYHNHDFEFKQWEGDVTGYDILMKECDQSLVDFELDLFWVVFAGNDPIELFKKHPGRFKMWHVKDMDKTRPMNQTEVGSGTVNFKSIFAKATLSGLEYFYVEQENLPVPGDANIKKSIAYIRKKILPGLK
ncbi:MAG: sugar phosphate isomerase/epimerase [Chitinophagaceae bacterium]|nr:sugar phosphate isomerase/epimerase [Chitinophagaceae bacterium]